MGRKRRYVLGDRDERRKSQNAVNKASQREREQRAANCLLAGSSTESEDDDHAGVGVPFPLPATGNHQGHRDDMDVDPVDQDGDHAGTDGQELQGPQPGPSRRPPSPQPGPSRRGPSPQPGPSRGLLFARRIPGNDRIIDDALQVLQIASRQILETGKKDGHAPYIMEPVPPNDPGDDGGGDGPGDGGDTESDTSYSEDDSRDGEYSDEERAPDDDELHVVFQQQLNIDDENSEDTEEDDDYNLPEGDQPLMERCKTLCRKIARIKMVSNMSDAALDQVLSVSNN